MCLLPLWLKDVKTFRVQWNEEKNKLLIITILSQLFTMSCLYIQHACDNEVSVYIHTWLAKIGGEWCSTFNNKAKGLQTADRSAPSQLPVIMLITPSSHRLYSSTTREGIHFSAQNSSNEGFCTTWQWLPPLLLFVAFSTEYTPTNLTQTENIFDLVDEYCLRLH